MGEPSTGDPSSTAAILYSWVKDTVDGCEILHHLRFLSLQKMGKNGKTVINIVDKPPIDFATENMSRSWDIYSIRMK